MITVFPISTFEMLKKESPFFNIYTGKLRVEEGKIPYAGFRRTHFGALETKITS
jgi:hypothetical protein